MWRTWQLIDFESSPLVPHFSILLTLWKLVFSIIIAIAMDQSLRRKPSRSTSQCIPTHPPPLTLMEHGGSLSCSRDSVLGSIHTHISYDLF
jgi:hypothetical protein